VRKGGTPHQQAQALAPSRIANYNADYRAVPSDYRLSSRRIGAVEIRKSICRRQGALASPAKPVIDGIDEFKIQTVRASFLPGSTIRATGSGLSE
jgi:hypothetical protein